MKKPMSPILSVVIAAFNEQDNIKDLTTRIEKTLKSNNVPYELIYVIAGTDNTVKIAQELQKTIPIKIIYDSQPGGLGNDFKKGFSAVSPSSKYVLTMDADLNHSPEEIPLFMKCMEADQSDIIIGSRYIKDAKLLNMPLWKRFVSKLANITFSIMLSTSIKDKTSGYRLYKHKILQNLASSFKSRNFEFLIEMLMIALKNKYKIQEIPITFNYRIYGKSKMDLFKTAKGYAKLLLCRNKIQIK